MKLTFATAEYALLCSSQRRMSERWGEMGHEVGRCLLDLRAASPSALRAMPDATMLDDENGGTIITFVGGVIVRGTSRHVQDLDSPDAEHLHISSVEITKRASE